MKDANQRVRQRNVVSLLWDALQNADAVICDSLTSSWCSSRWLSCPTSCLTYLSRVLACLDHVGSAAQYHSFTINII